MSFRTFSILIIILLAGLGAKAQTMAEPADTAGIIGQIEEAGHVKVTAPAGFEKMLTDAPAAAEAASEESEEARPSSSKSATRVGYRVLVFDDNNVRTAKHEAESRRRQMESRFPEFRAYTSFNSPYWRVKVGDFRTRSEAEAALAALRAAFPGYGSQLRVVRDRIN